MISSSSENCSRLRVARLTLPWLVAALLACGQKSPTPSSGPTAGTAGAANLAGQGGTLGGSGAQGGSSLGGANDAGEGGEAGTSAGSGGSPDGGKAGHAGAFPAGGGQNGGGAGTGGSTPLFSCPESQWLCHGVCVQKGSCSVRELRFAHSVPSFGVQFPKAAIVNEGYFLSDLTGDGIPDILYATTLAPMSSGPERFIIALIPGIGDCQFDNMNPVILVEDMPGKGLGFPRFFLADLNGDGHPDVAASRAVPEVGVAYNSEVVIVYLSTGGKVTSVETLTASSLGVSRMDGPLAIADIDGDGGMDLLFVALEGESNQAGPSRVLRRDKAGNALGITSPWPNASESVKWLQDVDEDGRAELLSATEANFLALSWGGASWSSTPALSFAPKSLPPQAAFTDVNADGHVDFLGQGEVWLRMGKGTFQKTATGDWRPNPSGVVDLDLDGNPDLPALEGWYRGDGFGHFSEKPDPYYPHPDDYVNFLDSRFGDATGDGVVDVVVLGGLGKILCFPNAGEPILK